MIVLILKSNQNETNEGRMECNTKISLWSQTKYLSWD